MIKKYLITSALPYINGDLHLGHLTGCLLPSDVYARFCRARGRDVLYICGTDDHGTPAMVAAAIANTPVLEYTSKYYERQLATINKFGFSLDLYGRTHTELQKELVQNLFIRLDEQGLIEERETVQPFSIDDNMFLADRQIEGICPKCGFENARGDQCDACSTTYEANELKNPRSKISGSTDIEMRPTKNLFFLASKVEAQWKKWLAEHAPKWSKTASSIAKGWENEGLRDTSITRDLSWGIPVNKPGYENKVFYVWFEAPWAYVSISQAARPDDWESWWKNPECHYAQFMGKDNVKFHSVYFPEQQLAMNDGWKTVDMLKGVNFLNFGGGKLSKSAGGAIILDDALQDAPADCWRYAIMSSMPETDDTDFTIQRFADIVNKDLNGMLGNFVSRATKLCEKNFGNNVPAPIDVDVGAHDCAQGVRGTPLQELESALNAKLAELTDALEACEFRKAVTALREIWAAGNEFMTLTEPWTLVKNGDMKAAGTVLNECFQLIDFYARVSAPFIPDAAEKMHGIFVGAGFPRPGAETARPPWPEHYERRIADGAMFIVPENLFARIDSDKIAEMTAKYVKK